jgi:hypothetical protein
MMALLIKLYRYIFCRGGYGVHSPFAFDLITTVIEETRGYYCYKDLHPVRLQLLRRKDKVCDGKQLITIKKMIAKYGFTEREHRLLFRLTNRFQPKTILSVGSDFGLTPRYLTTYSTDASCLVIEPGPTTATIIQDCITQYTTASIELRNSLHEITEHLDFVVWSAFCFDNLFTLPAFEQLLLQMDEESVMVVAGINTSPENRNTWKAICTHPKVSVTFDLYRLGVVFFNPKLHRHTYKSIVL